MARDRVQIDVQRRRILAPYGASIETVVRFTREAIERQRQPLAPEFEPHRTDRTDRIKFEDIFRKGKKGWMLWSPWKIVYGPDPRKV